MSEDLEKSGPSVPDDAAPPSATPRRTPVARGSGDAAAAPLTSVELRRALVRPDLLAAHVLGSPDRLGVNLTGGEGLGLLVVLLSAASLLATAPYGAFSPVASWWKVAALFTGSLLICFPCLHVFLQFLGVKIDLVRNLALALVITATAGLFSFGFFPIIWFIAQTTRAAADSVVTPSGLSGLLLAVSLLMGVVQMGRCRASSRLGAGGGGSMTATIVLWIPLFLFIAWRMAGVLGLRG